MIVGETAAPIMAYMRDWSEEQIIGYCSRKRWRAEELRMAEEKEFKNYDTNSEWRGVGMRLAMDPDIRETAAGKFVRFKVVSTSRNEGKNDIVPLWVEVNVADFFVEPASFMKKGDILHEIRGHEYLRKWGDSADAVSFCVERAQLVIPAELKAELKKRGWKPDGKAAAATKPGKRVATRKGRDIQELPEN